MNIAIIPARKGSKGVPNKNIKLLNGKPLIQYTIEQALDSKIFDEIFISSDSSEIMEIAEKFPVTMPFLRPKELAIDSTPMKEVILHVLDYFGKQGKKVNSVMLLQPTCPFRSALDIQEANAIFQNGEFSSVIAVKQVPEKYNPYWVYIENGDKISLFAGDKEPISRRQNLPKSYYREGSIYLFASDNIERFGNIYGEDIGYYEILRETVNIDTPEDFLKAEELILTI